MKLHNVTHNAGLLGAEGQLQGWCGPGAMSAITGRSAECCAAWINQESRRVPLHFKVRGTHTPEVRLALHCLGYRMRQVSVPAVPARKIGLVETSQPTFAQWLRHPGRDRSKMYLVAAGHHWMVVKGRRVVCTYQPEGNPTGRCKNRRYLVQSVDEIEPIDDERGRRVRAKRIDPLPEWSHTHRAKEGAVKRPYPKNHEVPYRA